MINLYVNCLTNSVLGGIYYELHRRISKKADYR
jgi:hypothetical protein